MNIQLYKEQIEMLKKVIRVSEEEIKEMNSKIEENKHEEWTSQGYVVQKGKFFDSTRLILIDKPDKDRNVCFNFRDDKGEHTDYFYVNLDILENAMKEMDTE